MEKNKSLIPVKSLILVAALIMAHTASAEDILSNAVSPARGAYVSLYGGWADGGGSNASQLGTVYFPQASGGPLGVNATGRTNTSSVGLIGAQLGYEWPYKSRFLPAVQAEFLNLPSAQRNATLQNPTTRLAEHTFYDTFPTRTTVILANAVLGFRTPYQRVTPYIGGGLGTAYLSIHGATSAQLNPQEPGINHFNSIPDSSTWTFAAQLLAGLRIALGNSAYVFADYRYLFIGAHEQVFGSTVYPTHFNTSPWTVRFADTSYNVADLGIGFHF